MQVYQGNKEESPVIKLEKPITIILETQDELECVSNALNEYHPKGEKENIFDEISDDLFDKLDEFITY
jgi:hypothetical protein